MVAEAVAALARDRRAHETQETDMHPSSPRPLVAALAFLAFSLATFLALAHPAGAFCGFYVAQADAKLFNNSSQVAIARDGDRTVVTMANDYDGPVKEFAIVVPVPTVLQKDQVHIGDARLIERLDAFSAPRLVEYHDPPPCQPANLHVRGGRLLAMSAAPAPAAELMAEKS